MINLGCKLLILLVWISVDVRADVDYDLIRDSLKTQLQNRSSENDRLIQLTHLSDLDFLLGDSTFILPCWDEAVKQKDFWIMDGIATSMYLRYFNANNSDSAYLWLRRTKDHFEGEWLDSNIEFIQLLNDIRSIDKYEILSQRIRSERININPKAEPFKSMRILYTLAALSGLEEESNPTAIWKSPREYLEQALEIAEMQSYRVGGRFKMQILMALSNYDLSYGITFLSFLDDFYEHPQIKKRPFYSKKPYIVAYDKLISIGADLPESELRQYFNTLTDLVMKYPASTPVRTDYFIYRMNFNFYKALGNNDSSLLYCDSIILNINPPGNNKTYYYEYRSKILGEQKRWQDAFESAMLLMNIRDSLARVSSKNKLAELQTQYELDDVLQLAEHKRSQLMLFAAFIALFIILSLVLAVRSHRYRIKNRILLVQLNEYALAIKNTPLTDTLTKNIDLIPNEVNDSLAKQIKDPVGEMPKSHELILLFEKLDQMVRIEKRYTESTLNRDTLTSELGVNKNKLSEAVYLATGKTINEYIVSIRLNEALLLIKNDPEISLTEVADQCGFGAYSTFYRTFFKAYGVKPAEYKKYLSEE